MNTKLILEFLRDLSTNNSKEWMEQNKTRYASVESLKTSRGKCMKTLREMARQAALPEMTQ